MDFIFDEEYMNVSSVAIENDQDHGQILTLDFVRKAIMDQKNISEPLYKIKRLFQKNKLNNLKNKCH